MHKAARLLAAAGTACLLASCGTITVDSWKDPDVGERNIGKTMVYAIGESSATSHQYETTFVAYLYNQGVEAHSMHSKLKEPEKLDLEALEEMIQKNGFHSIIVTRIVSEAEAGMAQGVKLAPTAYVEYWGDNGAAVTVSAVSPDVAYDEVVHLETNLYDIDTKKLIWSGLSMVSSARSKKDNMRGVIDAAVFDLKSNDLLRH